MNDTDLLRYLSLSVFMLCHSFSMKSLKICHTVHLNKPFIFIMHYDIILFKMFPRELDIVDDMNDHHLMNLDYHIFYTRNKSKPNARMYVLPKNDVMNVSRRIKTYQDTIILTIFGDVFFWILILWF